MSRTNPLIADVLRGYTRPGPAHSAYFNSLMLQAVVLLVWWPQRSIPAALASERGPATLLAVTIAAGIAISYQALRSGAEELFLPGQHPLREWALATPLTLGRILRGYVAGHLIQTAYWVALSSPLLLAAFTVSGGEWPALIWSVLAIATQGLFFRLAAAVVYTAMGHYGTATFVAVRFLLAAVYILPAAFLPSMSHLALSSRLLRGPGGGLTGRLATAVVPSYVAFPLAHVLSCAVLVAVLGRLLQRQRQALGVSGLPGRG